MFVVEDGDVMVGGEGGVGGVDDFGGGWVVGFEWGDEEVGDVVVGKKC